MLGAYQLDRAQRNLAGYAVLGKLACDCGGSCCGSRGLGSSPNPTLTATAAMQQAVQMYSGQHLNSRDFANSSWLDEAESQISAGQFDVTWYSSSCAGQAAPNLNLFATASGLALGTTSATVGFLASPSMAVIPAAAVPVVGWVVAGVSVIVGVISAIFAHHAAAVKRDLNFGCGALPAVNNAFSLIAQAVENGQMKAADAAAAIPQIYTQFMQAGGAGGSISGPSGIPGSGQAINNSPYCNSNCEMSVILLGMVLYWQAQYQAMASTAAAPAPAPTAAPAPVSPAPVSSAGAPILSAPASSAVRSTLPAAVVVTPAAAAASPAPGAGSTWVWLAGAALLGMALSEVF